MRWLAAATAIGVLLGGCSVHQGCEARSPEVPVVILTNRDNREIRVRVEVVSRAEDRARGLMHRRHLEADAGMLFVYPAEGRHTFWMKNTYLPLDMIFISSAHRVVGFVQQAQPLSLEQLSVELPSQYVLEVNAGFVKRHGIREGSPIRLEAVPGIR